MTQEEIQQAQDLLPRSLDGDRTFLEQFEEAAEQDKTGLIWRWLREEVYIDDELMASLR